MSKESSSSRLAPKTSQHESNENELGTSLNPINFPPPRTPLNSIPDPSQYSVQESELIRIATNRSASDKSKVILESNASVGLSHATPRFPARHHGRAQMEPSSVQSTPARSGGSRFSLSGRGISSSSFSRVTRGISAMNNEFSVEVPQFELVDDPLFWNYHNVQVLIRIRPLSTIERVSQGYARCLRQESSQTLVWLGHPETRFTFDDVACETISQEKLFRVAGLPMVENCLSGYNSCMFAYGQTGSGKTYTMMGEINEVEGKLSEDCGITPRIFEYLFSRIRTEEENRRDERLKFSCKCSFLEIYNEQITDLLEPSSTNLQLREDLKKGVYVENLTEYNVTTVNDVLDLLLEGAANRKMAATNMNSESSRSHSVFTCIIESQWEKDSMTHFRFARLNLVDLAGSERQKSSGAEGDRLKEAANINKSLSTLGLVIMSLVDLAHGKHRHVPYRDSRLTFLLQDSLGGNSKTTIIANVSPSNCSANETLSTLKFAQRAKLIQNDAKVNENASGDVTALQRQIQQLKGQLSSLMKHHNQSRSPSCGGSRFEESRLRDNFMKYSFSEEEKMGDKVQNEKNQVKCLEVTLLGALRREKLAETAALKLEAEIEHTNRLACQREEDAQRIKMMLKFREEKIKQLESLVNGSLSAEKYLMEEIKALKEEIQLLQARIDRNPELTRFALENIRLLEQLQLFQNFYELGEREALLAEVAELRDQILDITEGKGEISSRYEKKDNDTVKELEDCRDLNSKLMREVDELQTELRKHLNHGHATSSSVADSFSRNHEDFRQTDRYSLVESISMRSDSGDEVASYAQTDDATTQNKYDQNMISASVLHPSDAEKELMEARMLIEALESEQVDLFRELQLVREQNHRYMEILSNRDNEEKQSVLKVGGYCLEDDLEQQNKLLVKKHSEGIDKMSLQAKLDKLTKDLEAARSLNCQYLEDQASQLSRQHQTDLVCEQAELETSRAILHLQEDVAALQLELDKRLCCMTEENTILRNALTAKEEEIRALCTEWEKATLELTNFLIDGSRSLKDASGQIESIVCSFPQVNIWISEKVESAARECIEKEETILLLQKSLEDAQKMVLDMEEKLISLKGATIALNEFQQPDTENSKEEVVQLSLLLNEKINMVEVLESKLKAKEDQSFEAEKRAEASLLVVKWLSDFNKLENQCHILQQIKDELAETNNRLNIIDDLTNKNSSVHVRHTENEDLIDVDGCSADCSASDSDDSTESVASENDLDRSLDFSKYNPTSTEAMLDLKFQGGSASKFDLKDPEKLKKLLKQSVHVEAMTFHLRELETVFYAFNKLHVRLSLLLNENDVRDHPLVEGMKQEVPSSGLTIKVDEAGCANTSEVVVSEKTNHGSCFLKKFEEARETMREADLMLNALLKANEKGKQLNRVWRQAGKQLMEERTSLTGEVEKLKSSIRLKEEENEILMHHIHHSMLEIVNSMSSLEGYFQQIQKQVDFRFKELYSDVLSIWKEMCHFVRNSRSSLEDIFSEIMENGFALYVLYLCHVGELMHKTPNLKVECDSQTLRQKESSSLEDILQQICVRAQDGILHTYKKDTDEGDHSELVENLKERELCPSDTNILYENLSLKKELERKEVLLQGVLFDFSLLQESASSKKDIKDETEKLFLALSQVRHELDMKTSQLDDLLFQHRKLETSLRDTENALLVSNSNLEEAKETVDTLSEQNADLRMLLKDLYLKKSEAEEQLEEQKEVVKGLEKEILRRTSEDKKLLSSVQGITEDLREVTSDRDKLREEIESIEEELRRVNSERDELREEVRSLNDKAEMAYALADENEALAVEARQESEASKIYADQKEEEVKILEHSVEELECTINVLEKKVGEMDEEVERHQLMRESLQLEIQSLRQRLSTVESFPDILDSGNTNSEHTEDQMSRQLQDRLLQLHEAHHQIRLLEREREEQNKEIKRCKEYISEVVLHSEAQASQYQQKYKTLEAMIREMKTNLSEPASTAPAADKTERTATRTRGSSSPFRCIASLVQQMNVEKDQELSVARHRIEELEELAASRHKEVCMLNTRLAAAESMTHDVIRDLLGVKLDMTNYANLIDQDNVQKLLVAAHQQTEELHAKEQVIFNLRKRIEDLMEERDSCTSELNQKDADILKAQVSLEQLHERDQLLSTQNEILKMDKTNLLRRITELDDIVKKLLGAQITQEQVQQKSTKKESGVLKLGDTDFKQRLAHSGKLLSRVNDELAQYRRLSTSRPVNGFETKYKYEKFGWRCSTRPVLVEQRSSPFSADV
ncbi:kinesin-like protein KIN-12C [Pistacia vera]|uniref:kinesin-like protein KIN-12C n=1 Tax=Pistacia vera TaxID=55513 RepID=UPI001262FE3E|nr:kinesin-like protein KIN-12C [Pistacia vera]